MYTHVLAEGIKLLYLFKKELNASTIPAYILLGAVLVNPEN